MGEHQTSPPPPHWGYSPRWIIWEYAGTARSRPTPTVPGRDVRALDPSGSRVATTETDCSTGDRRASSACTSATRTCHASSRPPAREVARTVSVASEVRSSDCERPERRSIVSSPEAHWATVSQLPWEPLASRPRACTTTYVPRGVRARHDGIISVAPKGVSNHGEVHRPMLAWRRSPVTSRKRLEAASSPRRTAPRRTSTPSAAPAAKSALVSQVVSAIRRTAASAGADTATSSALPATTALVAAIRWVGHRGRRCRVRLTRQP